MKAAIPAALTETTAATNVSPYVDGKGPRGRVPRGLFTNRSRNLLWQLHAS
jgi:hypothetical protein